MPISPKVRPMAMGRGCLSRMSLRYGSLQKYFPLPSPPLPSPPLLSPPLAFFHSRTNLAPPNAATGRQLEASVHTSLPPLVQGALRAYVRVCVSAIVWEYSIGPPASKLCVALKWWGERSPGTVFRCASACIVIICIHIMGAHTVNVHVYTGQLHVHVHVE